jgi:hypothetical protein
MEDDHGVVARAFHVVDIAEAAALLARDASAWSERELAFARAKSDPERRLAARLRGARRSSCWAKGSSSPTSRSSAAPAVRRPCASRNARGRGSGPWARSVRW